jgi:hypothetical protein
MPEGQDRQAVDRTQGIKAAGNRARTEVKSSEGF